MDQVGAPDTTNAAEPSAVETAVWQTAKPVETGCRRGAQAAGVRFTALVVTGGESLPRCIGHFNLAGRLPHWSGHLNRHRARTGHPEAACG